jgi:hypothetical protein
MGLVELAANGPPTRGRSFIHWPLAKLPLRNVGIVTIGEISALIGLI